MMGGKVAKFGIFSPAVVVAKILLGEQKLNKVRYSMEKEGRRGRMEHVLERERGNAISFFQRGHTTLSDKRAARNAF